MGRSHRFLLTAVTALCVALSLSSVAQEVEQEELTWYAIEIIVFERTSEIGRNAETWPLEPGLPHLADALELSPEGLSPEELAGEGSSESTETSDELPAETESTPLPLMPPTPSLTMPRAFQLVAEEEYRLTDAWKSLDKSSAFRPLLHLAWIQPGYPSEEARLVHVRNANAALGTIDEPLNDGADEGVETPPVSNDSDFGFGFEATLSPRITVARDPSKVALDGTLRVHRARYLHVEADLLYYRPLEGDPSVAPAPRDDPNAAPMLDSPDTALIEQLLAEDDRAPRLFRLTERRRMRSRELHYLDHPLFGMLVEAWPVELPEMPAEALLPAGGDAPAEEGGAAQPAPGQSGSGG